MKYMRVGFVGFSQLSMEEYYAYSAMCRDYTIDGEIKGWKSYVTMTGLERKIIARAMRFFKKHEGDVLLEKSVQKCAQSVHADAGNKELTPQKKAQSVHDPGTTKKDIERKKERESIYTPSHAHAREASQPSLFSEENDVKTETVTLDRKAPEKVTELRLVKSSNSETKPIDPPKARKRSAKKPIAEMTPEEIEAEMEKSLRTAFFSKKKRYKREFRLEFDEVLDMYRQHRLKCTAENNRYSTPYAWVDNQIKHGHWSDHEVMFMSTYDYLQEVKRRFDQVNAARMNRNAPPGYVAKAEAKFEQSIEKYLSEGGDMAKVPTFKGIVYA